MPERLHIAHVVLSLQPGGLENGVVNVINGLEQNRFRSSVVCLKEAGAFADRISTAGTKVHVMGLKPGVDLRMPWRLASLFRRERIDIVHTRNAEAFFYGCVGARLGRVGRVVHSEHGRTFNDHPRRFWAQRALSSWTDSIFTVSNRLRLDLSRYVGLAEDRVDVLHNGVDLSRFKKSERDKARREFGLDSTTQLIGSVGRLVTVKNYPLLLRVLSDPTFANVHLVLIGDGPQRAELEALASSPALIGRVRMLGHRDDVAELMPAFDIFVLPSISEGMSNTLLEAMACGVPPVASRVGGNSEIIVDGESGLLFESGDESGLHAALEHLLNNAEWRARLGAAARQRVMTIFDLSSMICKYEALYERVVTVKGRLPWLL